MCNYENKWQECTVKTTGTTDWALYNMPTESPSADETTEVPASEEAECAKFTISVKNSYCEGLNTKWHISDKATCIQTCCDDPDCETWQFCDEPYCDGYNGGSCRTGVSDYCRPILQYNNMWDGATTRPAGDIIPAKTEPVTRKKGFSGFLPNSASRYYSCEDAHFLGLEDSWYYTWTKATSGSDNCQHQGYWGVDQGAEFVPMVTNLNNYRYHEKLALEMERSNAHFLLGYNEPELNDAPPYESALDWVHVQELAAMFDPPLRLVSPAPASEDFDADGHSLWLDQFLGNCSEVVEACRPELIEFVALHDYVGSTAALERRINGMAEHYGRHVWLTEFGIGRWDPPDGPTREEQDIYLEEVLPMLETNENLYRYVWFVSRQVPNPWGGTKSLLPYDLTENDPGRDTPTSTGVIYMNGPEGPNAGYWLYEK